MNNLNNIISQPQNNNIIQSIKNIFPFQPKIGLVNIGAPIYINPILQCFCNIEELISYFKYNNYIYSVINNYAKAGKNCLSTSFKLLIDNIWSNNKQGNFKPFEFIEKINNMSNLLKNNSNSIEDNIKNCIHFIISILNEELNQINNNNNFIQNNNIKNNNLIQAFNNFYSNYQINFNSFISKLFYAVKMNQITCLRCNNTQYNFETYFFLNFPLNNVRQYAFNKMQFQQQFSSINNNMINSNSKMLNLANNFIDIFDCFDYYQKIETLLGEDNIYCSNCKQFSGANYSMKLYNSPKILILIFDRENFSQNIKLDFSLELDLTSYFYEQNTSHKYKLIGVASYIIKDMKNLFFISHCLSPIDNKWYTYNDLIVNEVYDFKSQILNQGLPYLLFYQKID